ncbi:hypothetical protein AV530_000546 [Patagioenas fasciata monilis]|uniref:Uncharacterized protein n=1 Tax=Patagioenas fasciata monilis TaxID=372326 RepID=A0A1V4IG25_PATFA|nr:hypothetical protein AV530_000546 [Patagioenas fasciata monilis]
MAKLAAQSGEAEAGQLTDVCKDLRRDGPAWLLCVSVGAAERSPKRILGGRVCPASPKNLEPSTNKPTVFLALRGKHSSTCLQ